MYCIFKQLGPYFSFFLVERDYHDEVNGRKLLPSPRVTLNKNNISLAQKSLVASYKASDDVDNTFYAFRNYNGRFYYLCMTGFKNLQRS